MNLISDLFVNGVSNKLDNFVSDSSSRVWDQLTWGYLGVGGNSKIKPRKLRGSSSLFKKLVSSTRTIVRSFCFLPFLRSSRARWPGLSHGSRKTISLLNLTAESRLTLSLQQKSQNETVCQGFLPHPRSHPPEQQLSFGRILTGFSRYHDRAVKPVLPKGSS